MSISQEEVVRLLRDPLATCRSVAAILGCSHQNVHAIAKKRGLIKKKGISAKERTRIRLQLRLSELTADYAAHIPVKRLTKKYRADRKTMLQCLKDAGVTLRKPRSKHRELLPRTKEVIALKAAGMSDAETAEIIGISKVHVSVIWWKNRPRGNSGTSPYPRRLTSSWPYQKGFNGAGTMVATVDAAVPREYPDHMRADICQQMILEILEGRLSLGKVKDALKVELTRYRRLHPFKFAPQSLDDIVPGTEGVRMIDTIASDVFHF